MQRLWIGFLVCFSVGLFLAQNSSADANLASETSTSAAEIKAPLPEATETKKKKLPIGMDLNSFFAGPGLATPIDQAPDLNGLPSDTGLNLQNFISVKYRATERLALDVQVQNQLVVSNQWEYRHQGQQFGVSGELLAGEDWDLTGAVNTVVPVPGLLGQMNEQRTLLFNPGLFAFLEWAPVDSRWSMFTLLMPRMFFYSDRTALTEQDKLSERGLDAKPEYQIVVNPTVNYAFSEKTGGRFGVTFDYSKMVGWDSIRRNYLPVEFGLTQKLTKDILLYAYTWFSTPLDDDLRAEQGAGDTAWWKSTSFNLWLTAELF